MALRVVASMASAEELTILIPNDLHARYVLIQKSGSLQERLIVMRRTRMSRMVYLRRVYDCVEDTVHFLGSGLTLKALDSDQIEWRVQSVGSDTVAGNIQHAACD